MATDLRVSMFSTTGPDRESGSMLFDRAELDRVMLEGQVAS